MTDFVIVVATMAALASPAAAPGTSPPVPMNAPTLGFHTYADLAACERAVTAATAAAGTRLVCLPVESVNGELASAY